MERKYIVVCYMRIDPEEDIRLTHDEAIRKKEQLELFHPENIYIIKQIENR
jgi:hypothetical protein